MQESWWLKVKRAQQHMIEIEHMCRLYEERHPYAVVPIRQPKNQPQFSRRVIITEHPDPRIAVILGEFLYCLRSALDHIVVACSPLQERKNAAFPVAYADLLEVDGVGRPIHQDVNARERFESNIRGIHPLARAAVIRAQPYSSTDPETAMSGIINHLENADKHRELNAIGNVLGKPTTYFSRGEMSVKVTLDVGMDEFLDDGAVIDYFIPDPGPEVDVQLRGTAVVTIKVSRIGGNRRPFDVRLRSFMLDSLSGVRLFLREMEPFAL